MLNATNTLLTAPATAQAVQTTFNAWHVVALGAGIAVTHVYHTVVNAGGVKKLWSNFWNGPVGDEVTSRGGGERLLTSAPTNEPKP